MEFCPLFIVGFCPLFYCGILFTFCIVGLCSVGFLAMGFCQGLGKLSNKLFVVTKIVSVSLRMLSLVVLWP